MKNILHLDQYGSISSADLIGILLEDSILVKTATPTDRLC